MISLSVKHPDAMDFIKVKRDQTKITGANISLMTDDPNFMELVDKYLTSNEDSTYVQVFPVNTDLSDYYNNLDTFRHFNEFTEDGVLYEYKESYLKFWKISELWNEFVKSNWMCADPGIIFKDWQDLYSPSHIYPGYKNVCTNPCGEIMMSGEDSCRLIATNVIPFVSHPFEKDANLNYSQWQFSCFISAVIGDCLVDLEAEHVQRIIDKVKSEGYSIPGVKEIIVSTWTKLKENGLNGRRVGCGLTGIADAEAMLGLEYGNKQFTEDLMQYKFLGEWYASIALAECYGPFNGWDFEIDNNSEFFNRALDRIINIQGQEEVDFFIDILKKYGRRNISISTCAPNGTTSLLAGGISSGIEPVFKVESIRSVKVMNDNEEYDYVDPVGCKFKNYTVYHSGYQKWLNTPDELKMCKENPYKGCEAGDLNYHDRIAHQAIIQIYVSHSISSTVNLPKDTTPEVMSSIYHEAWKNKLKGN